MIKGLLLDLRDTQRLAASRVTDSARSSGFMAPKHHPTPLSGGDRKVLTKQLARARAVRTTLATRSAEKRAAGEALIREADELLCQSWNEKM